MNISKPCPGTISTRPTAAQLSIYLGFVHYRIVGATLAGWHLVIASIYYVVLWAGLTNCLVVYPGCKPFFMALVQL